MAAVCLIITVVMSKHEVFEGLLLNLPYPALVWISKSYFQLHKANSYM